MLSTTYVAPCRCARSARAAWSAHVGRRVGDRLGVEDPGRRGGERLGDGVEVGHVHERRPRRRSRRTCAAAGTGSIRRWRAGRRSGRRSPRSEASAAWMARHPGRQGDARPRRRRARRRPRRGRSSSGWRCGCRRSPPRGSAGDPAELVRVGRGEGGGLVDRDARRASGRAVGTREAARMARVEKPPGVRARAGVGVDAVVAHVAMLHRSRGPLRSPGPGRRSPVLAGPLRGVHRAVGADDQLVGVRPSSG